MASTSDQILARAAELMRDPDQVVLDPDNLYETEDGEPRHLNDSPDVCRGCLVGNLMRASCELLGPGLHLLAISEAEQMLLASAGRPLWAFGTDEEIDELTSILRELGGEGCAALIDSILAESAAVP